VVALHRRGGDAAEALRTARALFGEGADLVAPQAARPCNPFQSNLRAATPYEGFSWYLGDDPERPEAASFGDALAQLDLFAAAVARRFVLCGQGQGAALAIAFALHAPEGLVGVYASPAALVSIDGWEPPAEFLGNVEFVLADPDGARAMRTSAMLAKRRAVVLETAGLTPERWLESLCCSARKGARD